MGRNLFIFLFFSSPMQLQWMGAEPKLTEIYHINVTKEKKKIYIYMPYSVKLFIVIYSYESKFPWNFTVLLCRRCRSFEMKWDTVRSVFFISSFLEDFWRHPGVCNHFHTSWALITSKVTSVSCWASSGSLSIVSSSIEIRCIALEWGGDLLSFL